jgi:hypothetical protein
MAEYSKLARGSFTTAATVLTQTINLPFQPQRVKLINYTAYSAPTQYAVTQANWDLAFGQGNTTFEYLESAAAPWIVAADYTPAGIKTFAAGLALQYGPQIQIASITAANPIVVTTAVAHGLTTGQVVTLQGLYETPTTGMPQISGMPFVITVLSATTFSIIWNGAQSNYTALTASPVGAYVTQVLYPWLYLPGVNFISALTLGTTTTVTTTSNHNYVQGQEIAFRIPTVYGTTGLNSLPNNVIPGSPIYGFVTSVTSNTTFVCNINSSTFTAFNTNQPVSSVPGLQFPQVVAVGDVNTGGVVYSGGLFYPSPLFPTFVNGIPTINGPAISGAFVNNTSQGFIINNGAGAVQPLATLLTPSSLYIWEAYYYDYSR